MLPVAPADVAGTADALAAGLAMPRAERAERAERLARLRAGVEREDLTWWLHRQLVDLGGVAARRGAEGGGGST